MKTLKGVAMLLLLAANLTFWCSLLLLFTLFRIVFLQTKASRRRSIRISAWIAERWVGGNQLISNLLLDTKWTVRGVEGLEYDSHYLIISNHLSWVDIPVLFQIFHRRLPFIRFFLKQELIWMPFIGAGCWALEFPFMKRYTPEYLALHPEKRGKDLETTRHACRRYKYVPVAILNFVEGTRFTRDKHEAQESPYRNLLRPRIGGIAYVVATLSEQLTGMLDVTLVFPGIDDVTFWKYVSNQMPEIIADVRRLEIPQKFFDDAITEPGPLRDEFKTWITEIWQRKDELIEREHAGWNGSALSEEPVQMKNEK